MKSTFRLSIILLLCIPYFSFSQTTNLWTFKTENLQEKSNSNRKIIPEKYQVLQLDIQALEQVLEAAPNRFASNAKQEALTLSFPIADGRFKSFKVVRADVLHPDLAAKFSGIHSYAGVGIKDKADYLRFDITPAGLHAVIYTTGHSSIYIDPYMEDNRTTYISYYTKDYHPKNKPHFECGLEDDITSKQKNTQYNEDAEKALISDCTLRKYRLALACTGEYAQFHGGTVAQVLAAMNTTMMRVNGVYEREASITMEIIPNNDQLIFLDAATDPYTNNNGSTMLGQNQSTIDNTIGAQNYDIGHVFSTGGGGIAQLRSSCTSNKAKGVTGRGQPIGDYFDIDYVAHEMGHQFGGNHTQNNDCNSVAGASVEPGSASTIMGYAGICPPDVQPHSDDYFNVYNLHEIANFVTNGAGNNCPEKIPTGNLAPTADAGPNHTIPVSTPFELTGIGNDPDNSANITYCWEQMDAQTATMPPSGSSTVGPLFRSFLPTTSPTRVFPPIETIINNTTSTWNVLPAVGRIMNFTLSVRDNAPGGGCVADDDVRISVAGNAGPFLVTAPNTNEEWHVGSTETVTWDVANTDGVPVNCSNVDIYLSIDGGYTYPITLAEQVPNTGSYDLIAPDNIGNNNRVKIKGNNNVFFDISDEDFTISQALNPDFQMEITPGIVDICQGQTANFEINIQTFVNFSEEITFHVNGLPTGVTTEFTPASISGAGTVQLIISDFEMVPTGSYDLEVVGTAASSSKSGFVTINLTEQAPVAVNLTSPHSGAITQEIPVTLTWEAVDDVVSYQIEVADSPLFDAGSILQTQSSINTSYTLQSLDPLSVYYWRVRGMNSCGAGEFSQPFSFQTQGIDCKNFFSIESVDISPDGTPTVFSSIQVPDAGSIVGLSVQELSIIHSWVGDLKVTLTTPQSTVLDLFDQPGVPANDYGCDGDNILIDLTADAPNSASDLENTCNASNPAIEGFFQPISPFSTITGEEMQGEWVLTIMDNQNNDGGQLESWGLEICYGLEDPTPIALAQNTLSLLQGTMATVDENYLAATADNQDDSQLSYRLISLPENGTLTNNGTTLSVGDSFMQADVNAGMISYAHDNSETTTDSFIFDLTGNGNSWNGNNTFNIIIEQAVFSANLVIDNEIDCFDAENGRITAMAENGTPPFTYSLNGGDFQESASFDQLAAGSYTVIVKDNEGIEVSTNTVSLNNPSVVVASNSVMGSQVNVQASGGTGSLQYSLNDGDFQSSSVFSDVEIGTFTITVMDENGCTTTTTGDIIDTSLSASSSITQVISCNGEQDGIITLISSGGTPPFEYSIDGTNFQESNVFEGLAAGTYTFTIKDANDITFTTPSISLDNPPVIMVDYTIDSNSVTVTGMGGTGTLRYAIDGGMFALDNIFSDLDNGAHTISVEDENGCQVSQTIEINIIISANISTGIITCYDGNNGSIMITSVEGGVAPYHYQLNGGDFQESNIFEGLPAGDYNIAIEDDNGQTYALTASLGNPAPIMTELILDGTTLIIDASGPGPFMYSIDGGVTFSNENTFSGLENGSYDIVVTNENDCSAMSSIVINNITSVVYETAMVPWCSMDPADGQVTVTEVTGGVPPYTYSLDGVNFQESNIFENSGVENFTLTVVDSQGSSYETMVVFGNPSPFTMDIEFDGEIMTVDVFPTSDYQYSIDGGDTFQSENTFNITSSGTYIVVAVDGVGCEISETFVIDANVNLDSESKFSIYPNPNAGSFNFSLFHPTRKPIEVSVYDVLGRKILQKQVNKPEDQLTMELSLENIHSGTYLLKLSNEDIQLIRKVQVVGN